MISLLSIILTGTAHQEETIFGYEYVFIFSTCRIQQSCYSLPFADGTEYFSVNANESMFVSEGSFFHGMKVLATPQRRSGIA